MSSYLFSCSTLRAFLSTFVETPANQCWQTTCTGVTRTSSLRCFKSRSEREPRARSCSTRRRPTSRTSATSGRPSKSCRYRRCIFAARVSVRWWFLRGDGVAIALVQRTRAYTPKQRQHERKWRWCWRYSPPNLPACCGGDVPSTTGTPAVVHLAQLAPLAQEKSVSRSRLSPLAYIRRRLSAAQLLALLLHFWRRKQAKVVEVENRMLLSSLAWFTSLFCLVLMVCSCCLKACRRYAFSDGGGGRGGSGGGRRRSRGRRGCCDSCSPSRGAPSMCSADVAATPAAKQVLHWRQNGGVSEDGVLSSPGVSSWEQAAAAERGGDERVVSGF